MFARADVWNGETEQVWSSVVRLFSLDFFKDELSCLIQMSCRVLK